MLHCDLVLYLAVVRVEDKAWIYSIEIQLFVLNLVMLKHSIPNPTLLDLRAVF
jgi:hypothetical protein